MRPPQLTHEQSAPWRQARAVDAETQRTMAPPPAPTHQGGGFKPATGQTHSHPDEETQGSTSQVPRAHNFGQQRIPKISDSMGPPPTPQRPFSRALQTPSRTSAQNALFDASGHNAALQSSSTLQSNRFIPSSSRGRALSGPTSTSTSSTKVLADSFSTSRSSGGQRMPFMPESSNGFG
ncbi:hypothetical protein BS17DRAFT_774095 [Gyrodon lividus]|nr:hypothetical protein BS17DRAFT_774095 [Gyrodon lividus]